MLNKSSKELQKIIEYNFNNAEFLTTALTHKSYVFEALESSCNERMEFLGDSILSAVVAEYLYLEYPNDDEGKLSQIKSQIVSSSNLSLWAKEINLGDYVYLGKSENAEKARHRESLLCDAFEAVVGAVFLDGGFENAKKVVLKFLNSHKGIAVTDYKSRLQEFVQAEYKKLPKYKIIKESGKDHNKNFTAAVFVKDKLLGKGCGSSKKEAEQFAAMRAMDKVNKSFGASGV
jgi:ribonuclease-3